MKATLQQGSASSKPGLIMFSGLACLFLALPAGRLSAQTDSLIIVSDSLPQQLEEVTVRAYAGKYNRLEVPAAVGLVAADVLARYNPQSAVQAVNAIPGVRMDERSPSSYRLNIRGSSMRSPFGVRNVKVYYGDIPFTEPGGTSYLNQLGPLNLAQAEIIKGPGSSVYGAGTGGVLLLSDRLPTQTGFEAGYAYGSYSTHSWFADAHWSDGSNAQRILYQQNSSDGYRDQSASNRKTFNWDGQYKLGKYYTLKHTVLFGDLYYQTPGALTLKEYEDNPRASRPAAGAFPSASQAQAAIWQKTVMAGVSLQSDWQNGFSNTTGLYAAATTLDNATIRNYSFSLQPHSGGRTVFSYAKDIDEARLRIDAGAELQAGKLGADVYDNNVGTPADVQSQSAVSTLQSFVFVQAGLSWRGWALQAGSSLNNMTMRYQGIIPGIADETKRSFSNILSPRLSLSKALYGHAFVYASVAKGFSPPVTDELLPSGSAFNPDLQPEQGVNYELGLRYQLPGHVFAEVNAYYFRLDQTIVQRRDAGGGDYYVNAGNTLQPGMEASLQWTGGNRKSLGWELNLSYAYQPYTYGSFLRGQDDFSGKQLPGVSEHNGYAGLQLRVLDRFRVQANYFYNSKVALNDLNSAYGGAAHQLSARLGYDWKRKAYHVGLSLGIENILDSRFSLGYDINAAGSRYYNAAPGRNYFVQLVFGRS